MHRETVQTLKERDDFNGFGVPQPVCPEERGVVRELVQGMTRVAPVKSTEDKQGQSKNERTYNARRQI